MAILVYFSNWISLPQYTLGFWNLKLKFKYWPQNLVLWYGDDTFYRPVTFQFISIKISNNVTSQPVSFSIGNSIAGHIDYSKR